MNSLINIEYVKSAKSYLMNSTYALKRIGEGASSGDVISIQRFASDAKNGMLMAANKIRPIPFGQISSITSLLRSSSWAIDAAVDAVRQNDQQAISAHIRKAQQDFDRAVQYLYVLDSQLHRGSKS